MNADDLIFALDIGTRTIIGVVGKQEQEKFHILAADTMEHTSRVMLDGQIHDIEGVAAIASTVKQRLEKKLDITLKKVAIAAAGRVLKTKQVKVQRNIDIGKEIDRDLVKSLEMEGMQLAQMQLDEELLSQERTPYYCVGYDVIHYYLNDYVISSLVGHKGKCMGADILATFLPQTVVDSLYTVMNRIGLEITNLTLEPIAAINVAIPKDLRLLNLALVDIGAGTSDIAITKNGSVVAYDMVPVAGDEITEMLCHHYLLDFNTAEKIKLSLSCCQKSITFTDILGLEHTESKETINNVIRPAIERLANVIAEKIFTYNPKAPNAVFVIGGGSQIEGLTECIAAHLNLPSQRVAVRNKTFIQNIISDCDDLSGPDAVTPIGIAVTAQMQRGQDFLTVIVNEKKVTLFNTRRMTVADALVLTGFDAANLIGKTGKPLHFTLNGEPKSLKGGYGTSAEIYVNNKRANLETQLSEEDEITVKPAQSGEPARLTIQEVHQYYTNGNCTITVNGIMVDDTYYVKDGDVIETVATIHVMQSEKNDTSIEIDSMDDTQEISQPSLPEEPNHDELVIVNRKMSPQNEIKVTVNGNEVVLNGDKQQYIFVDIFNFIDFDLTTPKGSITLKLNGRAAGYTDIITSGDEIEVYWKK